MAEFGQIPCRVNGVPVPAAGDIQVQMQRNVTQKPTTDGVKIVYGLPKYQVTLSFPTLAERSALMLAMGVNDLKPATHNLGYDMAGVSFSCLRGVVSGSTVSSNQDGDVSYQLTCMYEDFQAEGALLSS